MVFKKGNKINRLNLINKRFHRLVVINFAFIKYGHTYWQCKCNCGKIKVINSGSLKSGLTKSCGCLRKETTSNTGKSIKERPWLINDLVGKKFNRLTVISLSHRKHNNNGSIIYWKCLCDCGKYIITVANSLKNGHTKSCGCLHKEQSILNGKNNVRHGLANTKFWTTWRNIKTRCYYTKDISYKNYGGRGIKVCNHWHKFDNFMVDMYESYLKHCEEFGEKQTTIDRINNNGNYCKENCKWSTYKEQQSNTR